MFYYKYIDVRLLSDENIFMAICLAPSYIKETGLLSTEDRILLQEIKDIYNNELMHKTIEKVKEKIKSVLYDENNYFNVKVFFKPKTRKNNTTIFRPIHTASLIDQIAMTAMSQVLIFNDEYSLDQPKLVSSELSRLIPSNFYGNRISYKGISFFKPWQEQYHNYSSDIYKFLSSSINTNKFKYEIDLDLKDFFPSIDPKVIFNFIYSHLPLSIIESRRNRNTIVAILRKLLFFRIINIDGNPYNPFNEEELSWYLHNTQDEDIYSGNILYAKGLPQGFAHTYYFANLMMIPIQEIYKKYLPGEMMFYVDDSVIFTKSEIRDFNKTIESINNDIHSMENKYRDININSIYEGKINSFYPNEYNYHSHNYGIEVHSADEKSKIFKITDSVKNTGEIYLSKISREVSALNSDIILAADDETVDAIFKRTTAIYKSIEMALNKIDEVSIDSLQLNKPIKFSSRDIIYRERLIRYKKFFKYRKTLLQYRRIGNVLKLKNELLNCLKIREASMNEDNLETFFENYTDDILAALIPFVLRRCSEENYDISDVKEALNIFNMYLYNSNSRYSYIERTCSQFYTEPLEPYDKYNTLKKKAFYKYKNKVNLSRISKNEFLKTFVNNICKSKSDNNLKYIFNLLGMNDLYKYSTYIRSLSESIERNIINTIFSFILGYAIDDSFIFSKTNSEPIKYSDLRLLAALRNPNFKINDLCKLFSDYTSDEFQVTADYSILQVMDTFKKTVIYPNEIDQLIRIHKYCCDTWKNGSKFLYFYTLHNQEHAITLIKNIRKILNSISFFEISSLDYFIVFASCYLHDISMVSFPEYSQFYGVDSNESDKIYKEFLEDFDSPNIIQKKEALCTAYKKIDSFFEGIVRGPHAFDSANEIRKFSELNFINPALREFIARVSEGHGLDTKDVYNIKSHSTSIIDEQTDTILLRLSDLLDITRYRISKIIFDHNIKNINEVSRFHWISHLLTDGFKFQIDYISDPNSSPIEQKSITERITLTVNVLLSQFTPMGKSYCCNDIKNCIIKYEKGTTNSNVISTKIVLNLQKGEKCQIENCPFLCRWFNVKNNYLVKELSALQDYLDKSTDNYFKSQIVLCINPIDIKDYPNDILDYINDFIK